MKDFIKMVIEGGKPLFIYFPYIMAVLLVIILVLRAVSRSRNRKRNYMYDMQQQLPYSERVMRIAQSARNIYSLKNSIMNGIEQYVFCHCEETLKKYSENYYVFPQARVSSFVDVRYKNDDTISAITSKSVDLIICRKDVRNGTYLFVPLMVIEVDGTGHTANNSHVFKDYLFPAINIPFRRLTVASYVNKEHEALLDRWIGEVCRPIYENQSTTNFH